MYFFLEAQQLVNRDPKDDSPEDIADPTVIEERTHGDNKSMERVVFAVAFYWAVSLSLVFVNKMSMSNNAMLRDVPLFFSWTQLLISVAWYVTSLRTFWLVPCMLNVHNINGRELVSSVAGLQVVALDPIVLVR